MRRTFLYSITAGATVALGVGVGLDFLGGLAAGGLTAAIVATAHFVWTEYDREAQARIRRRNREGRPGYGVANDPARSRHRGAATGTASSSDTYVVPTYAGHDIGPGDSDSRVSAPSYGGYSGYSSSDSSSSSSDGGGGGGD